MVLLQDSLPVLVLIAGGIILGLIDWYRKVDR